MKTSFVKAAAVLGTKTWGIRAHRNQFSCACILELLLNLSNGFYIWVPSILNTVARKCTRIICVPTVKESCRFSVRLRVTASSFLKNWHVLSDHFITILTAAGHSVHTCPLKPCCYFNIASSFDAANQRLTKLMVASALPILNYRVSLGSSTVWTTIKC